MDPGEFTFGRSLNKGCAHAEGELIVIASAHVYPVYPDWLEKLLAPFEGPDVALVYGKQRGSKASHFSELQIFASWFPEESSLQQKHPFCNNANAAIRRSLWEQRPYDETLPGLEDLDWATWALSQGHRIAYSAEAEVVHIHEESFAQIYNRYRREAMGLKQIHPQEFFHLYDLLRLYLSNVISDLWHALGAGRIRKDFFDVLAFRWMQFWGTYRGFRQAGPLTGELKRAFYYPREMRSSSGSSERPVDPINYRGLSGRPAGESQPNHGEAEG
jgi:cellulose synthase/poly-beta-1,6-N-acetylglucosamine synthase-like glycosyltransferase